LDAARASLVESLTIYRERGEGGPTARGLEAFAGLAATNSQFPRSLRLAGAASSVWETAGRVPDQEWRDAVERWLLPARQSLNEQEQAAAWTTGRAMPLEEAI